MLFSPKEKGQGLVEYALILVLVAIVVIAALMILGPIIGNVFSKINSSLASFQSVIKKINSSVILADEFIFFMSMMVVYLILKMDTHIDWASS